MMMYERREDRRSETWIAVYYANIYFFFSFIKFSLELPLFFLIKYTTTHCVLVNKLYNYKCKWISLNKCHYVPHSSSVFIVHHRHT